MSSGHSFWALVWLGGPMRLPDRRLQMYTWPPSRYLSSVCLFRHCQTLHLTDSLQSFFFEIYSVLGAFKFHLAEPRAGPSWFSADFWGDMLLKSMAEATPCHLQSLSLREAPPSLLNYHHCQELHTPSPDKGWGCEPPPPQPGPCSTLVHPAGIHSPKAKRPSSTNRRESGPGVMGGDGYNFPPLFSLSRSAYLEHTPRAVPCSWRGENYGVPICHSPATWLQAGQIPHISSTTPSLSIFQRVVESC